MKKAFILILAITIFSCSNKPTEVKHFAHDSGKVFALYHIGNVAYTDIVRQDIVTQNRFDVLKDDSTTAKKTWVTDTFYQVIRYDSLKRPLNYLLPKDSVLLVTKQFEPILKEKNLHFMEFDTTKKKQ